MFHCCSFVSFVEAAQWVGKSFVPFGENSWKCTIHYQWKWSQQLSAVVSFPSWRDGASGDTFVNARPLCALEVDSHGCLLPYPPPMSPTLSSFHLYSPPSSLSLHSSRHWADRHSSSAGTLAQVDQVSHLPGDCAACAFLWLSAAQLEVFSAPLVCCHVR